MHTIEKFVQTIGFYHAHKILTFNIIYRVIQALEYNGQCHTVHSYTCDLFQIYLSN